MTTPAELQEAYRKYRDELVEHRLLVPCDVPGVFGRGQVFEDVIERVDAIVTRVGGGDGAEVLRFPPIWSRRHFNQSDYLKSFPDLVGSVHGFRGTEKDHQQLLHKLEAGEDWALGLPKTDVVLTPAACYPIYPSLSGQTVPAAGKLVDVLGLCFRYEPSPDPARMQMFRQREYVRIGPPQSAQAHRELWMRRGQEILGSLLLPGIVDVANDPFFGRAGRMLAANQRDQALKFELLVPICSEEKPTACVSFNYHQDHFGQLFQIKTPDGAWAHTACVGFGLERIALALFKHHGFFTAKWPAAVREKLWP